jgi:hypothetical protein
MIMNPVPHLLTPQTKQARGLTAKIHPIRDRRVGVSRPLHHAVSLACYAFLGLCVTAWYGRKALPLKRGLSWEYSSTRLLATEKPLEDVDIVIRGERLTDPYLTQLRITNVGKVDLDSVAFDRDRPLRFEVLSDNKFYMLPNGSQPTVLEQEGQSILVGPDLLESHKSWTIPVLTDGPMKIDLGEKYLPNFPVRGPSAPQWQRTQNLSLQITLISIMLVLLIIGLIALLLLSPENTDLVFERPGYGQVVGSGQDVTVSGTVSNLDGKSLWVVSRPENGDGRYYLTSGAPIATRDGAWSFVDQTVGRTNIGSVIVYAGVAATETCSKTLEHFASDPADGNAGTFAQVPAGCTVLRSITLVKVNS